MNPNIVAVYLGGTPSTLVDPNNKIDTVGKYMVEYSPGAAMPTIEEVTAYVNFPSNIFDIDSALDNMLNVKQIRIVNKQVDLPQKLVDVLPQIQTVKAQMDARASVVNTVPSVGNGMVPAALIAGTAL